MSALQAVWCSITVATVAAAVGLLCRRQLIRWYRRLRAAHTHPARHRLIKESPMDRPDLPEQIRVMLKRIQKPAEDGRGRRWAADALPAAPEAVDAELVAA